MPRDLPQLRRRIVEAVVDNDGHILQLVWLELDTGLTSAASQRVDISSTCKVGQKLGVSLPLLTYSPRRDHPGYCTAEVGNPGGTYESLCIKVEHFLIKFLFIRIEV
jgi:hypothetical protein